MLQQEILGKIHEGHQGIIRSRDRARQSVWWPGLSAQLEALVRNCETCCTNKLQRAQPLVPSQLPDLPWQKVGTDLFEWRNKYFLLIIDYYSWYIEIAKLSQTTAEEVILYIPRVSLLDKAFRDCLLRQWTMHSTHQRLMRSLQVTISSNMHKKSSPYCPKAMEKQK